MHIRIFIPAQCVTAHTETTYVSRMDKFIIIDLYHAVRMKKLHHTRGLWPNLTNIVLSKINQTQNTLDCIVSFI